MLDNLRRCSTERRSKLRPVMTPHQELQYMMDIILITTAIAFFGVCFAYTHACDRL